MVGKRESIGAQAAQPAISDSGQYLDSFHLGRTENTKHNIILFTRRGLLPRLSLFFEIFYINLQRVFVGWLLLHAILGAK